MSDIYYDVDCDVDCDCGVDYDIDCNNTSEIVCPYCGHTYSCSYEYARDGSSEENIECEKCEKQFKVEIEYSISYSSMKIPCLNGEGDHRWSKWHEWCSIETRRCRDCDKVERRDPKDLIVRN